jgi:hypothetical protein
MKFQCFLSGHDDLPVFATNRLYLRCTECRRETPGWAIGSAGPGVASAGAAPRNSSRTALGRMVAFVRTKTMSFASGVTAALWIL